MLIAEAWMDDVASGGGAAGQTLDIRSFGRSFWRASGSRRGIANYLKEENITKAARAARAKQNNKHKEKDIIED
jgi:hypothetical protein